MILLSSTIHISLYHPLHHDHPYILPFIIDNIYYLLLVIIQNE
jgi:hypothetical protein